MGKKNTTQNTTPVMSPVDNPDITFTLKVKSTDWDFNRDLADDRRFVFINKPTFKEAFQKFIANFVFDNTKNAFSSIELSEFDCSSECDVSYQKFRSLIDNKEKLKIKEQLEALKREQLELEKRLKA